MKTYAIALKRSKERYSYIQNHLTKLNLNFEVIDAVDGRELTGDDLEKHCNMEQVNKLRTWLNNGAIGCALSHYTCYEKIVASGDKSAFVVEDDVMLPENIKSILSEIEVLINPDEVILLYYISFNPCKLSNVGKADIRAGSLVYPININQTITTTAYVIGKDAAKGMLESIKPIAAAADSWGYYFKKGAFKSLRVHFPMKVRIQFFKSSIEYIAPNSITGRITTVINQYKIPIAYQYLKKLRRKRINKTQNHFSLVDDVPQYLPVNNTKGHI